MDDYDFMDVNGLFDSFDNFVSDLTTGVDSTATGLFGSAIGLGNSVVNTANNISQGVQNVKNAFSSSTPNASTSTGIAQAISATVSKSPALKWGLIAGAGVLAVLLIRKLM